MPAGSMCELRPGDQIVRPLQQHAAILGQHAEHVPDQRHRQRGGDIADEVTLAPLADGIDQCIAQPADRRLLLRHPLTGEPGVDELAPQQVCRIVHVDHVRHPRRIGTNAAGVGEQLRIALGIDDGLIRRRADQAVAIAEHRLVGAHPPIGLARRPALGVEVAVGQIDIWPGLHGCHEIS